MKKTVSIYIILFNCIFATLAQNTFDKTYGTSAIEEAKSVRQTLDGGYILGGTNLVKVDNLGIEEWTRPFPSLFANPTADSSFILIRSTSKVIIFTKVASNGDSLWQTYYREGVWANQGMYIEQVQDGGYIVAGRFQSVAGSGMLLLKLNSQGNKVWRTTFSEATSAGFNYGFSAQQTIDKGYIIAGYANINWYDSTRNKDVFIVKTDSSANEEWRKFFGGARDDYGSFVKQDDNGNYFIAATTYSQGTGGDSDMLLIKLDSKGDSLWTRTYGGNLDETATGLWPTNDGGCMLVGTSNSFTTGDQNGYMVKTDKDGNTLWTKNYGGSGMESMHSVQQTSDGGYVMAGSTDSKGAGGLDMFLLKTDSLGEINISSGINGYSNSIFQCDVFPNPTNGVFSIRSELKISAFVVTNVLGEIIYSAAIHSRNATFDLSQQPKGIYFYQINFEDKKTRKAGKLIFK